ncbi:MAG: glycosyltransferase family 4 protein [Puniceicoccaceae bacterium]
MIQISHPTGNANVRNAVRAMFEADLLEAFITFLSTGNSRFLLALSKVPPFQDLTRRMYDNEFSKFIKTSPLPELLRVFAQKANLSYLTRHESGIFSIDKNNIKLGRIAARNLLKSKDSNSITAVYCYEDSALETFEAAKAEGIKRIYELPTGYWRKKIELLEEEKSLQPEWASLLPGTWDSAEKCERKDHELELADLIITSSSFTEHSLEKFPSTIPETLKILYGAPSITDNQIHHDSSKPIRALFVGNINQQKGISYLFKALDLCGSFVELTVIGELMTSNCKVLNRALQTVRYFPSIPHSSVLEEMRQHDVLIFPTLFDGFGLVILEAMSQGMTVIATTNSGAPDIINNEIDGFIVPIRSSELIAEKLELLNHDRDKLQQMQIAAREKAAKISWQSYRERLVCAVRSTVFDN